MTKALLLLTVVVSTVAATALAVQPDPSPAEFYHQGAQRYVEGDKAGALPAVEAGLALAPDDAKLQALRDLIQEQQEEQDNQDGGQQDEAENTDPGDQGEEGDDGEQGENEQGSPPGDDGQEAESDRNSPSPSDPTESGEPPPSRGEPGEMTEAQAHRRLDAVGGEEELLLRLLRRAPSRQNRSDKDW